MSIRFPDLQVLFPRSAELAKVQPASEQATQPNQHAQTMRAQAEHAHRTQTVADADESTGASIRERRRDDGGRKRKDGRERSNRDGDDDSKTGRHIDIKA